MSAQLMKGIEGDVEERKGIGGGVVMEREVTEESVFGADAFYGIHVERGIGGCRVEWERKTCCVWWSTSLGSSIEKIKRTMERSTTVIKTRERIYHSLKEAGGGRRGR